MKSHVRMARALGSPKSTLFPPSVISIFQITVCDSGNDLGKKNLLS